MHMGVSKNRGTHKSSILIGFSMINHPFWGTPIFGNTHIGLQKCLLPDSKDHPKSTASRPAGSMVSFPSLSDERGFFQLLYPLRIGSYPKMTVVSQPSILHCYASFREGTWMLKFPLSNMDNGNTPWNLTYTYRYPKISRDTIPKTHVDVSVLAPSSRCHVTLWPWWPQ